MKSLPEQHIEDLPAATRKDAYVKVGKVFLLRREGTDSEVEVARKAGFGSADAMHQQLSAWGFAGLLPPHRAQQALKSKLPEMAPERKARSSGPETDLPPAANAMSIFQGAIEKLSDFVERLPLRKEHRQGERFVVTYAKPLMEPPEPGEEYGYLETSAEVEPGEHGSTSFALLALGDPYRRVAGGASRHPDDGLVAAIATALLTGTTTDELLEVLHRAPTQDDRKQARVLFEEHRDSLKKRARQLAALIRGYPIGRGQRTNAASKEWHLAAWVVQERLVYKYSDDEIARWLNEEDSFLPELKRSRKVTVGDVRDLKSLDLKPWPGFPSPGFPPPGLEPYPDFKLY
jgi:hypothetical protein